METTKTDDGDAWLCSVLPGAGLGSNNSQGSTQLEMHKRLVHLATLREQALKRLQALDTAKVSLTEKKALQQGRLLAALDARLASAHAAVEPHRVAVQDHIKALEKAAGYYSNALQGVTAQPTAPEWASVTQQYQHLQQQQEQYQQQQEPAELARSLAASMQPCAVAHVEIVEQLRCEKDQLQKQLQHDNSLHEQVAQQVQQERAARLLAEQQKHSMQQELQSLRQLAQHVAQQLQLPQQPLLLAESLGSRVTQPEPGAATPSAVTSSENLSAAQAFMSECKQLHQQLQQVSAALGNSSQHARTNSSSGRVDGTTRDQQLRDQSQQQQCLCQMDLLQPLELGDAAAVLSSDPLQQLHAAVLGLDIRPLGQRSTAAAAAAAAAGGAGHAPGQCFSLLGAAGASQERLRQAYQQMLRQVQARYQQELRQNELQHQEALQSQSKHHTEALSQVNQQYQGACTRLAAAATEQGELRQQLAQAQQQNQLLQQQVQQLEQQLQKVQADASASAASALAVAQVQHEQQLIALRQEHEQLMKQGRQDLQQLTQQLKEQAAALPSAVAVAAMVDQAAAKQLKETEEQYQAALQQREEQHLSLLQELAALRQLHAEPSSSSMDSAAELPVPVQQQQQQPELVAVHSPAQASDGAAAAGCGGQLGLQQQQQQHSHKLWVPVSACRGGRVNNQFYPDSLAWHNSCDDRHGSSTACVGCSAAADVSTSQQQHPNSSNSKQMPLGNAKGSSELASPMSSLIAAVLGSGPRARSLQEQHTQRVQQQLSQQQQQQQLRQLAQQLPVSPAHNQSEQLDDMLGLTQATSSGRCNSSAAAAKRPESPIAKWQRGAEAAAAAEACQATEAVLQQLNMPQQRSVGSTAAPAALKQRQQHVGRIDEQQPHGRAINLSQQQQQPGTGGKDKCLRCGGSDMSSPGRCCFHPGLIPVPGPLMYSPEWHACRANCTPDMPGCYSRREHYYLPSFGTGKPAATVAGSISGKAAWWQGTAHAGATLAATAGNGNCRRSAVKSAAHGQSAATELTPRTILPRPITPRQRTHRA